MRGPVLRFAALDRFDCCPPLAGSSVWGVERHVDTRSFADVTESECADEWSLWIDLGGEG